jgi:hypothetical protein
MLVLAVLLVALPSSFLLSRLLGDWRRVATSRALEEAGVLYIADLRVFLVHRDEGPLALSALTPGGRVLHCASAAGFQAPDGARFDGRGLALTGAERDLDRVAARLNGTVIEIGAEVVRGPPMEAGFRPLRPPPCVVPGPEDPPGFAAERGG